jgi:hypothetical protein
MKIRIGGIVQKLSCIDIVGGGKGRGEESNQGSLKPSKNEPTDDEAVSINEIEWLFSFTIPQK